MNDKILSIIITAKDEASAVMAKVGAEADAASASMGKMGASFESAGRTMSSLGSTMTRAFTLPIVGVGAAASKMAMDFQQAMTYVRTDAGDTTDNIDQLSNSVLNLAKTSQFGPDQLAQGLYHLASLGLRGADAMNALNTAQQMASVGGADLESTATALGAALVTGIRGVQDYSQAAGTLDAIIGAGNMRMQDLVDSLGTGVLTAFKNAGLSLQEYGAALATLTDNGMNASESATRLRMTIAMMTAPTGPAKNALEALGMTANQLGMDMQTKGLIPALTDLKKHLLDTYGTTAEGKVAMQQSLSDMFGGGRSSSAIITLLDQLDRVGSKETQISQQSGEFATKVAEQQQTAAAKMKTAWSAVQVDMIKLGSQLLPVVANALNVLAKDIDKLTVWWDKLSDSQQHDIEKLGEILIVGGPVLSLFGKMVGTFGTLIKLGSIGGSIFGKLFGGLSGAGAGAAGLEGIATESGLATTSLAGLATALTGPVGIALLGTAAAAGVAYVAYKKFQDDGIKAAVQPLTEFNRLANETGVTLTGTASKVDLVTLAQVYATDAQRIFNAATDQAKAATDRYATSQTILSGSQVAVNKAQDDVKAALDTFGQSSPQYQKAASDLAVAQSGLSKSYSDTAWNALDAYIKEGNLATAEGIWKQSKLDMTAAQNGVNAALAGGVGVIATFGPTAINQTGPLETLHQSILGVVKSFDGMSAQIQTQSPILNSTLQGINGQAQNVVTTWQNAANNIQLYGNMNTQGGATSPKQGGAYTTLQGGKLYATGGFTGSGGTNEVAGFVHKGEYVVPKDQVNQTTGKPYGTSSSTVFHMHGNINLGSADAVDSFFERLDAQKEMGALGVGV